ncbi:MAG: sulfite exporter TauE/SafE family protein [Fibromonadaceae bacterium]|jgi:sulfite exporter TauE/SafE/copper chaperone CopZ|nr:sulfite exporter TauE/SafE family protein [Fibromonadaceae bacterium]
METIKLHINGMTCTNCSSRIEKKLLGTSGVQKAEVSYNSGMAVVTYDAKVVSLAELIVAVDKLGYKASAHNLKQDTIRIAGFLIIVCALYIVLQHFGILNMLVPSQLAKSEMAYGMLFLIGLMTSVHCLAMCGGINLSQCVSRGLNSPFLYSLGRVISYTAVGFVVGALGSVIDFSVNMQGVLKLVAGLIMIIMGINLLGVFPLLRKLTPRMPQAIAKRVNAEKFKSKSPLIVGFLNGFMPCGPLQAMQIYALSTGSPFTGALSMLLFSLGTVPLTFSFGAFSSMLGQKFTRKATLAGATLVVVLGMSMFTDGWSLTGFDSVATEPSMSKVEDNMQVAARGCACCQGHGGMLQIEEENMSKVPTEQPSKVPVEQPNKEPVKNKEDSQTIKSTLSSYQYPNITVKAGIPVKWLIEAPKGSINGCNNRILIREYGIEHTFKYGENLIEFTPAKPGKFLYTCWMGMMRATITVVDN